MISDWVSSSGPAMPDLLVIVGSVVLVVAVVVGLAMIVLSASIIRAEKRFAHMPAPKRESFFFGNFLTIARVKKKLSCTLGDVLYMWSQDVGPVYWIRSLFVCHVIACSPEFVKELFLNSRHVKPWDVYRMIHSLYGARVLGNGIVTEVDHEKWSHKRALMNPAFKRKFLMGFVDQFNECAETLCQQLLKKADGKTLVSMLDEFNHVTFDIIAKTAFSMDTDVTINPDSPLAAAMCMIMEGMQYQFDNPWAPLDPRRKTRMFRQEVRDAITLLREAGRKCVSARITARQRGDSVPVDTLNVMLDGADDLTRKDYDMENMLDDFLTLFVAGHETTSSLLSSTLLQLGRHPEVAKKLQEEVDEVLGQKSEIEYEDIFKLEYMMRVFKETLRLYPPAPGLNRVTNHEITHNGMTIPAGTMVGVFMNVMARSEEYFDDPLLFNPDRFKTLETSEKPRHLYAYFPFSTGQRSCIGQQYAYIEARVILGKLLQKFDFRLNQSQRPFTVEEFTSKPLDRCKNYITPKL